MTTASSRPTTAGQPDCPLCDKQLENTLWESPQLRIIHVPDTPFIGYVRLVWLAHVAEMSDLSAPEQQTLMHLVFQVEALQRQLLHPDKINVASLGNQVAHVHWHVIPRWRTDPCFPDAIWAPSKQTPEHQAAWQSHTDALQPRVHALHEAIRQIPH